MRTTLLVIAAALAAGGAWAQDRPPDWLKRPTADDLMALWPAKALREGKGGKAVISCVVTVQGALRQCRVVEETPPGEGFGAAAIALSAQFLMRPAMKGGVPVESSVAIPINFPRPDRATGSYLKPTTDTGFPVEPVFTGLPWRAAPSFEQVLAAYPAKAREAKVGGSVVLDCRIDKAGTISACQPVKETPERYGFAAAAKSLAPLFATPVVDGNGQSIAGAHVHLPVTFAAAALETTTIGRPAWRALPAMEDFTAVIPPAAREAHVYKARVVMTCVVVAEGAIDSCQTDSEDPAGLGYADAAVALSHHFRLDVWTSEGLPTVGGKVKIPLRFDLEDAARTQQ